MRRMLVPTSALLWGLQIAFLSPALALILVGLYDASTNDVGWVLAIYNAAGFIATLLIPAWADRHHNYLGPLLGCGVLTLLLVIVLGLVTTLPLATIALIVIGGPAGVSMSMFYAHLRHGGASAAQVVNTRALVSVAWIAGPPLATFIIGGFGPRGILVAIGAVALANIGTTMLMIRRHRADVAQGTSAPTQVEENAPALGMAGIVLVTAAFVLFQATNSTSMSFLAIYVPRTMGIDVLWAGVALGVAAGLEVPALMIVGRLTTRFSSLSLVIVSCVVGVLYYVGLAAAHGPIELIALQLLNAACFAGISGVGLTLFQQMIASPGMATGLYMNTRRIGAIVSGPLIAVGSLTVIGERGIFVACALLTVVGILIIAVAARNGRSRVQEAPEEDARTAMEAAEDRTEAQAAQGPTARSPQVGTEGRRAKPIERVDGAGEVAGPAGSRPGGGSARRLRGGR